MALTFQQRKHGFQLGDRLVLPALNRIRGPGGEAHLEPKVMAVLMCLAEHAGEVVCRDSLYEAVWGNTVVTDQALTNCVSELRHHLGDDRTRPRFIETMPKTGYRLIATVKDVPMESAANGRAWRGLPDRFDVGTYAAVALLVAVLIALGVWSQLGSGGYQPQPTVVSLPFENAGGDDAIDYLRVALPDEITTLLTESPNLAVRSFEPGETADPLAVARARKVGHVITGHYYLEGSNQLAIAIEAQNVEHERLVWRARITVPADDLLAMRERIAERIRSGLLPALGASVTTEVPTDPYNANAYRLYLRSLTISRDPGPNRQGIEMLGKVVREDPGFAPAWTALATRYHYDALYGDGGEASLRGARDAAMRSLEADPGLLDATHLLIVLQTEAGELTAAYRRARELVDRRGRSGYAHFALAFVLRYAGMLDDAQRHCDAAAALDPHYFNWRSCALAFMSDGKLDRAAEFIALDSGSYWSNLVNSYLRMREDDRPGALRYARSLPPDGADRQFIVPCLEGRAGPLLDKEALAFAQRWQRLQDSEPAYHTAAVLAYCGRVQHALEMLRHATDRGYCAYPALDNDPIWEPLRGDAGFQRERQEAIDCHRRFRGSIGDVAAAGAPPV
jgi:DNA-binding winged helix-turn-helix (wHTH) protein/TolB-like protein